MGEQLILVGTKFSSKTIARLDQEVDLWNPFVTKRGPMVRALAEIALEAIDAGILERKPRPVQGYLRQYSVASKTFETAVNRVNHSSAPIRAGELTDEFARAEKARRRP